MDVALPEGLSAWMLQRFLLQRRSFEGKGTPKAQIFRKQKIFDEKGEGSWNEAQIVTKLTQI